MPTFHGPDWFSPRIPLFEKHLAEFVGKPKVRFLEVGSYEGRSALWMLENVLTGPGSHIDCVDPWENNGELPGVEMDAVHAIFAVNIEPYSLRANVTRETLIGAIRFASDNLCGNYDFVYIDGSHRAADVLTDSAIAWQLLKVGGIMAWDDMGWRRDGSDWDHPATAVIAFMACLRDRVQVLSEPGGQQVWVRKVRP